MKRANYDYGIALAKAMCILLMVIGHSGCPTVLHDNIYTFHMPLFFICSGFFFRCPESGWELLEFIKKRFKGLYIPFVKWSLLFLLFHNFFIKTGLLGLDHNQHLMSIQETISHALKIVIFMGDAPILVAGFWFLRVLLLGSIITAIVLYYGKVKVLFLFLLSLLATFGFMCLNETYGVLPSLSIIFQGMSYYIFGIMLSNYKQLLKKRTSVIIGIFAMLFSSSLLGTEMITLNMMSVMPYMLLSILAATGFISLCKIFSEHIGSPVMGEIILSINKSALTILALHFSYFKIISYCKMQVCHLTDDALSMVPVIREQNELWWVLYSFVGFLLPLSTYLLFHKTVKK